ncbi:hypothetical protein Tco_0776087 [Tanacetum coccineum]
MFPILGNATDDGSGNGTDGALGTGIREYDGSGNGTDGALGSGTREYDGPGNGTDGVLGSGTREYDGSGNGTNGVLGSGTRKVPLIPLWIVGLDTWGGPRLMVTSSSSSSWYAHHTGSSPTQQVQTLKETIRRLQEDNAQMRSRFERDMQVQLQREVERQVQEHTQQRELEANAREQTRDREWQQREFDVLLPDTPVGIRSSVRMEEVIVSAPVQECLDMEVDKVEGDAKLTEHKKPNRRKKCRSKNKLLAKGEDTENPNTSVGAIASADQEMIIQSPAAETASHDILTLAATVDEQMTVLSPAPVQECLVMETDIKRKLLLRLTKTQKKNRKRYLKKKRKRSRINRQQRRLGISGRMSKHVSKGANILNTNWDHLLKKKSPLSGDILNIGWNQWPKCGKNMVAELREKGIHMNEEKFGTYKSTDGYAREYDIAGAKEMILTNLPDVSSRSETAVVDMVLPASASTRRRKAKTSQPWTTAEVITLCKAWCDVTENNVIGEAMKIRGFWSEVVAYFEKEMGRIFEDTMPSS